jgi:predicted nucleotidyltransferase
MKNCNKEHLCSCGKATHYPHETGKSGCTRRISSITPIRNAEKVNTHQEWQVGDHSVSDYTLKEQRGYRQYECGCWTRARESTNSLPDEFG